MRAALAVVFLLSAAVHAAGEPNTVVTVQEHDGVYTVAARFSVPEPPAIVRAVLTDYANIPRFLPTVRTSRVLDREETLVRVEQEAVLQYLLFSKRIHLVLDVEEGDDTVRFRDRCRTSFARYEGSWTIEPQGERTELRYQLVAEPTFGVPEFLLRKLLDRDARVMIDGLRAEIAVRTSH